MKSRERACRASSAKKALLWGALAFVVLQLSLTLVMEAWLPQFRDPPYAYKAARLKQRIRAARAAGTEPWVVVMVGSSRVADGLRGTLAEQDLARQLGRPVILFNLGIHGDGPMNELLNLERLLADGVRPDLVLIEVLPSLLSEQSNIQFDLIPAERMGLRDRWVLRSYGLPVGRFSRYTWLCWGAPWYAHRLEVLSALLPCFLPRFLREDWARECDDSGWSPPEYECTPEARQRALEAACGAYGRVLRDFHLGNPFCDALGQVLEKCRREHLPAALVWMPESRAFQQLYSADAERQTKTFLDGLRAEYGLPLINARDWVADADSFLDGHHLLPAGAAAFTTRLARERLVSLLRALAGREHGKPTSPAP